MRAIVLLASGFEEIEAVTVIDVLRRAEVAVVVASLGDRSVRGSRGIVVEADATLDAVGDAVADLLYLPGGADGMAHLAADARVGDRLRAHLAAGKTVAAICASTVALHRHGVLPAGCRVTSHPSVADELADYDYTDERVVADGPFVTSRGAGTALELALGLVERLRGGATRQAIADAVLAKGA